jgi:uncharacterized repeat protein (TIGR01451 family)
VISGRRRGAATLRTHMKINRKRRVRKAFCCGGCALVGILTVGGSGFSAPASAAPVLKVSAVHTPTNIPPGGNGQYKIVVKNVGDSPTVGPVSVTASLPTGVTAVSASDPFGGLAWGCTIEAGGSSVTCSWDPFSFVGPIQPGFEACGNIGTTCRISMAVTAAGDASGTGTADVEACDAGTPTCGFDSDLLPISPNPADFGLHRFDGELFNRDRSPATQAGAHPWGYSTTVEFNTVSDPESGTDEGIGSPEDVKTLRVDLPSGLIVDPSATPTRCSREDFQRSVQGAAFCPLSSQVGTVDLKLVTAVDESHPVYNVEPAPGVPAQFGFEVQGVLVVLNGGVRAGGDYGLTAELRRISQAIPLHYSTLTLWGVPADPAHDAERGPAAGFGARNCGRLGILSACPVDVPLKPLLTNPMDCSAGPLMTKATMESWESPGTFKTASFDHDRNGVPMEVKDCDRVPFDGSFRVRPTNPKPDAPSGYEVEVRISQTENPEGLATSHLKKAVVTLPEGVSVNPASADGLEACSPAQIGLDNGNDAACPKGSKIGSVEVDTPLLQEPMTGDVFVAKQADNPFGSLLAMYLVARAPGVMIKLAGHVEADPATGQLTATFDDNPQLPFTSLHVSLQGGPTAPLANPPSCGQKTATAVLTPWSGTSAVTRTSSFSIDCLGASGFAPAFRAGSLNPVGGGFSPFAVRIDREDGQQYLGGVTMQTPPGLLAKLKGVALCLDTQANAGTCGIESRVGTATVGAGPGATPFFLEGGVFLTGPYKGAPYGLAVVVRAIAGPYDLGTVVVRQALHVDRRDAHVTVVSDPLPTILEGIPLRLRSVNVDVDRPGFTLNPTSCRAKQINATLSSTEGAVHRAGQRFQVAGCSALPFRPRLGLRLTGRRHTRLGRHPGIRATVRQGAGQAAIERAVVRLPKSLALDADNAQALCEYADGIKDEPTCPEGSIVGRAKAVTPLLNRPLTGNVYFVKNVRTDRRTGAQIRTLPMLVVALRGEIAINLRGTSSVRGGRLISKFASVPDAPISRFNLNIKGGKTGILAVTRTPSGQTSLCQARQRALVEMRGHNGRRANFTTRVKTPCKKPRRRRR